MSLVAIITGIIIVAGIGVGLYFILIKKKSTPTTPVKPTSPAVVLDVNVGTIENKQ